jgi:hypothetical protein
MRKHSALKYYQKLFILDLLNSSMKKRKTRKMNEKWSKLKKKSILQNKMSKTELMNECA